MVHTCGFIGSPNTALRWNSVVAAAYWYLWERLSASIFAAGKPLPQAQMKFARLVFGFRMKPYQQK
jgi:hypothetical protein